MMYENVNTGKKLEPVAGSFLADLVAADSNWITADEVAEVEQAIAAASADDADTDEVGEDIFDAVTWDDE